MFIRVGFNCFRRAVFNLMMPAGKCSLATKNQITMCTFSEWGVSVRYRDCPASVRVRLSLSYTQIHKYLINIETFNKTRNTRYTTVPLASRRMTIFHRRTEKNQTKQKIALKIRVNER